MKRHAVILWVALASVVFLSANPASAARTEGDMPVKRPLEAYVDPNVHYPVDVYDPLETFNRGVYKFNAQFDRYVFLPVVRGYEFVLPKVVRKGVSNFFANLADARNFVNNLLQGKAEGCVNSAMRIVLNTTIGIGGLLDPATPAGYPKMKEDFGETLGVWGLGPGPYLVIPIFGPSSIRDGTGLAFDSLVYYLWSDALIEAAFSNDTTQAGFGWGLAILLGIDTRSNIKFRYYETGSPFEYELVRFLYLKKREFEIAH